MRDKERERDDGDERESKFTRENTLKNNYNKKRWERKRKERKREKERQ